MAIRTALVMACSAALLGAGDARATCRGSAGGEDDAVQWLRVGDPLDAGPLDGWCTGVGKPVLTAPEPAREPAHLVERLALVAWNVRVGDGAVETLVAELRAGELTGGRPVEHFALLLQEAVRVGPTVPHPAPPGAVSARPIGTPTHPARSIEALAERTGLFAFYAPSMRNGASYREDRGNAILSTLPLEEPQAIELPYERQRRVAVSVRVDIPSGEGPPAPLRLVSVHLDNTSSPLRFWRSFGSGRAHQARALAELFDGEAAIVVGGDFNTWYGEADEEAIALLRARFPLPLRLPPVATYQPPYGLPERQVDYLLLRLPGGWRAHYRVGADRWASDHSPLIGWVETRSDDVVASEEPE